MRLVKVHLWKHLVRNDITGEINAALRREDARGEAFDVTGVSLSGRILAD